MIKSFCLAVFILMLSFNGARAEEQAAAVPEPAKQALTLNGAIDEALKNNPQIRAALYRYEAAGARVRLLRTLDDPKFEYEYDKITASMDAVMNANTAPMRTFAISQEFPFPTKLFLRKHSAQKESDSARNEYKEKENEIIQRVKESYLMISLSSKEIQITQDTKALLEQLIQGLTNRYSLGQANQQEVLKAQTEYSKLENQVVLLGQKKRIAISMLKSLLNKPQDYQLPELADEAAQAKSEIDKDKILNLMKQNRPELKAFKDMLGKSEIEYSLAKQEYLPDMMVKYKREDKNGSAGAWSGMIGISVPLWFWEKQASFVKEAKAQLEETKSEYQNLENMVSYEVESAMAKVDAQKNLVKLYETSFLPQADLAFKTSASAFEAGKADFLNLLDSLRMLLEFKLDYARAMVDLEIAYAELEKSVGTNLEILASEK